jgi:CheY-like chemotaxis protein
MSRILVADDNSNSRELVRTVLERGGHHVVEAADGAEALELAKTVRPDLVILDLSMPKLGGFEVVERLRREPYLDGIPVVALTASAMAGDKERALAAGFTGYLTKPIGLSALRAEVERLLRLG